MAGNFYTGKDADIVAGSANFASLISSSPTDYGLVASQAAAFGVLNAALQAKYLAATTPETRTPVAIQGKNLALSNMRRSAVVLAKIIYATQTVTDEQLVALGLSPRAQRAPRNFSMTPPVVEVTSVSGRLVGVRLHDPENETRRGKPFAAAGCQLFSYVGPVAPTDPREYHFEGMTTRTKTQIIFPNSVPSGATVWLSGCWVSQRGQIGNASTPISFTLQGGAISAAA